MSERFLLHRAQNARLRSVGSVSALSRPDRAGGDACRRWSLMVAIYVRWIRAGRMSADDVPEMWREEVRRVLEG